jgi:cysteine desulfuration protein SufE
MLDGSIDELKQDFALLDEWEDRYRYVIELGRTVPALDERERTPENKVQGCASQVWIASHVDRRGGEPVVSYTGDSDALIVKGLIAIVFKLFSGRPAREIIKTDAGLLLDELDLRDHLTPQRSNGVASMIARIKRDASSALAAIPG